ncbi:leucine-rich repeat protein [Artemisia annua]|uniref:Leucine-rich repeat protein n=1 Tax=Artemisia annua TaxID=35608 RepID=A0A2U1KZQ8_ARTAN|nr:leucine-rich repeat protein [Artemisia annua]
MNPWLPNKQAIPFLVFTFVQIIAFSTVIHKKAVDDRVALFAVKSMINGDPQGVMSSWNDSIHFCQWEGITCGSRHQRVTILDLSSRGLSGSLSPSIGNLSFLKVVQLQNNSLSGEIPPQVGRLIRLQDLRVYNNNFHGKIPASLANCSSLEVLDMGNNNLVGKIPDEFGSLSMLDTLIFHDINLEGGIPRFIGNLTFLDTLWFVKCGLGGRIPYVFHQLSKLKRISLHENNLVGTVPRSFYNLSSLEEVFLNNNRLTGRLPINVGLMQPRLNKFSLSDNQFTGSLPPSLLSSPELTVLDVARNNFSGKLVITSRKICKLFIVSLSSNSFGSGDDDDELYKFVDALSICRCLRYFDMSNNSFGGVIPQCFEKIMSSIEVIDLGNNFFCGTIPNVYKNCGRLEGLILNGNQLEGEIPISLSKCQSLKEIYSEFQFHEGRPKEELKTRILDHKWKDLRVDGEEVDEKSRFTWKVVMLGYGCGTFLGLVLGCLMLSTGRPKWFNANVDAIERMIHTRRNKRRYRYIGK